MKNVKKSASYITPDQEKLLSAGIAHKYGKIDINFPDTPENRAIYDAAVNRLSAGYKIYNRNCDNLEEYDVYEWRNSVCCHYSLTANEKKSYSAFLRFARYFIDALPEDFNCDITIYDISTIDEDVAAEMVKQYADAIDGKAATYAGKDGEIRYINGKWGFLPKRWRTRWYPLPADQVCLLAGIA